MRTKFIKISYFIVLFFITLTLIGCKKENNKDEELLQSYYDELTITETVNSNFYLPYRVNNKENHTISWTSSDLTVTSITTLDGSENYYVEISPKNIDITIILTATIKMNSGMSKDKTFSIIIKGQSLKDKYNCISISKAFEIAKESGESGSNELYYIYGTIVKVTNPTYGEMTITDGTNELYVYGTKDENDVLYGSWTKEKPVAGDEVVLYGRLKMFNGSPEMDRSIIKEFNHIAPVVDTNEYQEMSINDARKASEGEKIKLSGVVATITNAFGNIPNGFYLIDGTGSIYVYGSDASQQVSVGNKVTIACEKTYYINPDEITNAKKYNYEGALQVQNPIILDNDKGNNEFDKTWIKQSTVKDIIDTKMDNNITSDIFKVNAFINKDIQPGYVNYYINDLDGKTGSYVYTMCNGSDFSWLDKYDGKICTIYLSPINCKSTLSGTIYRFIPIEVEDNGFVFDEKDACEYAIKYHIIDQFKSLYQNNPKLNVITNVSSEILGFSDVEISYESSDNNVIYFENDIMNTNENGNVKITITAKYKEYQYTTEFDIEVRKAEEVSYSNVKDAISCEDGTTVVVRGIVASSLINQTGFYLVDETGIVAITCSGDVLSGIELGNDVIVEGVIGHRKKEATGKYAGQIEISNSKVLVNYYGNNEYSKQSFITDKTINDICSLDYTEDHSAEVYVVKGKIRFVEAEYYTNYYITSEDGKVELLLYSSNGSQYSWLKQFGSDIVTLEIAPVNWNSKNSYKGCVISVSNSEKTVVNDCNFSK